MNYDQQSPIKRMFARLSVFGLVITIIGYLDGMLILADWVHRLVKWWPEYTHVFWSYILSIFGWELRVGDSVFLTTAAFYVLLAVGARLTKDNPLFAAPKNIALGRAIILSTIIPVGLLVMTIPVAFVFGFSRNDWNTVIPINTHTILMLIAVVGLDV